MTASEEAGQEGVRFEQEDPQEEANAYEAVQEESLVAEEKAEQGLGDLLSSNRRGDKSSFIHGLAVGLGISCLATFVIIWITVFFTPRMPTAITYEGLLAIFIYPLIYILGVGLIALTAGIVREYFSVRRKF